jgi:hypothetical protein
VGHRPNHWNAIFFARQHIAGTGKSGKITRSGDFHGSIDSMRPAQSKIHNRPLARARTQRAAVMAMSDCKLIC